jgi:hypothetical protein
VDTRTPLCHFLKRNIHKQTLFLVGFSWINGFCGLLFSLYSDDTVLCV